MSEAPDAAGDSVDKLPAFRDNPTNVSGDDEKDSPRLPPLPTTAVGSTTLGGSSRGMELAGLSFSGVEDHRLPVHCSGGDVSPLPNVGTPSKYTWRLVYCFFAHRCFLWFCFCAAFLHLLHQYSHRSTAHLHGLPGLRPTKRTCRRRRSLPSRC